MSIQNSPSETAVFIAEGMTKTFPGVTALEDVRLPFQGIDPRIAG